MYYHKVVVVFSKTASSTPYFLHVQNIMAQAQAGSDYKYYLIAYGILGQRMDLDPNKTYDYHTWFEIIPTKVIMNVPLDMNGKNYRHSFFDTKKILNRLLMLPLLNA